MSRMTALDALLADADNLLFELDEQTITESLERGEAPDFDIARQASPCPWCRHEFHGLRCAPPVEFLIATLQFVPPEQAIDDAALPVGHPAADLWPCHCDGAHTRLDDTWRPWFAPSDTSWLMHVTGLDGWSARALYQMALDQVLAAQAKVVARWLPADDAGPVEHTGQADCPACARMGIPPGQATVILAGGRIFLAPVVDEMHFEVIPTVPFHADGAEVVEVELDDTETPAARALRLHQTRNTGPERPTAERARRPRQHR